MRRWRWVLMLLFLGVSTLLLTLVPPALVQESPGFSLRLLHTNDHHAHLDPVQFGDQPLGGIARRRTLIQQLRSQSQQQGTPSVLLDAGDIFQGTLYFLQYQGQADVDFYNVLQYDAATLGNHEFDRGPQVLADFIHAAHFPLLSANLEPAPASVLKNQIKPWIILPVGGQKLGILGLTTAETPILSSPGKDLTFTDPIQAAQTAVQALQAQGVNKIIAITHLGLIADRELARQVAGIDIIVGGHSHTPLGTMPGATNPYPIVETAPDGQPVLVVTAWEWGKYLGDLLVQFNPDGSLLSWQGNPRSRRRHPETRSRFS
ncbi:metallophosphoesterase, partial [Neosynechococcus sphagnicola]|uniref:metallophosphoesterase n=1 Tax=Neosynechococcus sphagnicola TaxID=1501145 RepID=UPI0019553DB6